jgi:hypothetical protein
MLQLALYRLLTGKLRRGSVRAGTDSKHLDVSALRLTTNSLRLKKAFNQPIQYVCIDFRLICSLKFCHRSERIQLISHAGITIKVICYDLSFFFFFFFFFCSHLEFSNCMYDDPIYSRVINLILIFFLLICFRTNARHGVWGALRLSHNTSIVQLPVVFGGSEFYCYNHPKNTTEVWISLSKTRLLKMIFLPPNCSLREWLRRVV